jgi:hypothetical protein
MVAMYNLSNETVKRNSDLANQIFEFSSNLYVLALTVGQWDPKVRKAVDKAFNVDKGIIRAQEFIDAHSIATITDPKKKAEAEKKIKMKKKFKSHIGQVEIVRENQGEDTMELLFFPIPSICKYLTKKTKGRRSRGISSCTDAAQTNCCGQLRGTLPRTRLTISLKEWTKCMQR